MSVAIAAESISCTVDVKGGREEESANRKICIRVVIYGEQLRCISMPCKWLLVLEADRWIAPPAGTC